MGFPLQILEELNCQVLMLAIVKKLSTRLFSLLWAKTVLKKLCWKNQPIQWFTQGDFMPDTEEYCSLHSLYRIGCEILLEMLSKLQWYHMNSYICIFLVIWHTNNDNSSQTTQKRAYGTKCYIYLVQKRKLYWSMHNVHS